MILIRYRYRRNGPVRIREFANPAELVLWARNNLDAIILPGRAGRGKSR